MHSLYRFWPWARVLPPQDGVGVTEGNEEVTVDYRVRVGEEAATIKNEG